MVVANLCFISVLNIFYTLSWPQDKAKLRCRSVARARAQDLTKQCSCSSRLGQGVWELCPSEHVPSFPQGQAKMRWPVCPHLPARVSHVSPSACQGVPSPPACFRAFPLPLQKQLTKMYVQLWCLIIFNQNNQYLNIFFFLECQTEIMAISSLFFRHFLYLGSQKQRSPRSTWQPLSNVGSGGDGEEPQRQQQTCTLLSWNLVTAF